MFTDAEEIIIYNVHSYGFSDAERSRLLDGMKSDRLRSVQAPHSSVLFVGGDFNFLPRGEERYAVKRPPGQSGGSNNMAGNPVNSQWVEMCESLIDIQQSEPTHFHSASMSLARLDRLYTSLPASATRNCASSCVRTECPQKLHGKQVSDHAPVRAVFAAAARTPLAEQPIPVEVIDSPYF